MNSLVAGNVAQGNVPGSSGDGGAIWHLGGYLNLGNNTIVNNIAAGRGGGVYTDRCIASFIYNSILWGNLVGSGFGPQMTIQGSNVTWNNNVQGGASDIELGPYGGWMTWSQGNIDADPLFVDPDGPDDDPYTWEDNDFHLQLSPTVSPSIDTGNANAVPGSLDLDQAPRMAGCAVDMGAHESAEGLPDCPDPPPGGECYADLRADVDYDGDVDWDDEIMEDSRLLLLYENTDDDNHDGIPDDQQAPVEHENNLMELRLSAPNCEPVNPAQAWWSLAWPDQTPPLARVWPYPDKSDGSGSAGTPLVNGAQQPWPPPESVWLESLTTFSELQVTFTVFEGNGEGGTATAQTEEPKTDKVSAESKSVTPFEIKLRVVMLVEPGANLDEPPTISGGTRLSRDEVTEIVNQLEDFGDSAAAGLTFVWDDSIIKLESKCMRAGACYWSDRGTGNPRELSALWYHTYVVNHPGGGPAELLGKGDRSDSTCPNSGFCDGYDASDCTLNVYFIGGLSGGSEGGVAYAGTVKPYFTFNDCVFISDGAESSNLTKEKRKWYLSTFKILEHEAACHWAPVKGHSSEGVPGCPNDLCMKGQRVFDCSLTTRKVADHVPEPYQDATRDRLGNCGEQ